MNTGDKAQLLNRKGKPGRSIYTIKSIEGKKVYLHGVTKPVTKSRLVEPTKEALRSYRRVGEKYITNKGKKPKESRSSAVANVTVNIDKRRRGPVTRLHKSFASAVSPRQLDPFVPGTAHGFNIAQVLQDALKKNTPLVPDPIKTGTHAQQPITGGSPVLQTTGGSVSPLVIPSGITGPKPIEELLKSFKSNSSAPRTATNIANHLLKLGFGTEIVDRLYKANATIFNNVSLDLVKAEIENISSIGPLLLRKELEKVSSSDPLSMMILTALSKGSNNEGAPAGNKE